MRTLFGYNRTFASQTGASMHLALSNKNGEVQELNHGFGILFPRCNFDEGGMEGQSKGLIRPWIFRKADGGFAIVALRRNLAGEGKSVAEPGMSNRMLLFSTDDLIQYKEEGLPAIAPSGKVIEDVQCIFEKGTYLLAVFYDDQWHCYQSSDLVEFTPADSSAPLKNRISISVWDAEPACSIEISDEEAAALLQRFTAPDAPEGTEFFPFPLMPPRADPMAFLYKGKYLFIATDDENNQLALKIRVADSLKEIPSAQDHQIFHANKEGELSGCIWAPELHKINGKLCILFSAGKPHWYTVQSHIIMLEGEDLLNPACWSEPRRIVKADGSPLAPKGSITLDMTVVKSGDHLYVIWSQRPIKTDPVVCGTADLLIARLDAGNPWKLASEPVVLSRPEYGWERINSAVNEGAFAFYRKGRIFVTYSAALIDATYCMGMLEAEEGADLCDPASWTKTNYPVLHRLSTPGQIGSGHCAFVKDESGREIMLFHALDMRNYLHDPSDGRRYPGFRPVLWDASGYPHFDGIE